jgi:hypothetical protein
MAAASNVQSIFRVGRRGNLPGCIIDDQQLTMRICRLPSITRLVGKFPLLYADSPRKHPGCLEPP